MSEYRRFVAYFYEYADGKKQQNAGFAKVELRDGMWRILFRLTISEAPEPTLQQKGFVRENEDMHGLLLGTRASNASAPEEWAWRADTPVGLGKVYFGQLNGMRIAGSDGRNFFTVWDDEPMNPAHFVTEPPQPEEPEQPPPPSRPEAPVQPEELLQPLRPEEPVQPEQPPQPEKLPQPSRPEIPAPGAAEVPVPQITELPQPENPMIPEPAAPEMPVLRPPEMSAAMNRKKPSARPRENQNPAEILLRSRQGFRPFQDEEFTDCVQIRLCDILPFQQENWKIGRNNFLQHGYYLYRHLLLGRTKDGSYILGVPGMRSRQEEYMAQTFGYDHFKQSGSNGSGRNFGYWYRILKEPDPADRA